MIPEFAPLIMSVSSVSRHRTFATPMGSYEYFHQDSQLYAAGMDRLLVAEKIPLLIATPEKALCDALARRGKHYHNKDVDFMEALLRGLRIEEDSLRRLDLGHLESLGPLYDSRGPQLLHRYLLERLSK